jgi:hypothetical protein
LCGIAVTVGEVPHEFTGVRHLARDFCANLASFGRAMLLHNAIFFLVLDNIATNDNQTLRDATGTVSLATICLFTKSAKSSVEVFAL